VRREELRALARLFAGSRGTLRASVALSIAQALALLPVALLVQRAFDTVLPDHDVGLLALYGVAILGLYLASAGLALYTSYLVLRATKDAITTLRGNLLERLYALPQAYFDRTPSARLHAVVVQDSERLDVMANALVGNLLPAAVVAAGLCATLGVLEPVLFAALLVVVPALIGFGRLLGARVRKHSRRWADSFDVFSGRTHLALRAMTLTRVLGAGREELERRRVEHAELGRAGVDMAWRQSAYTAVQAAIGASTGALVLVVGGRAVARGDMSLGALLSFYAVLGLLLRQLGTIVIAIPRVLAGQESLRRLDLILGAADEPPYRGTREIDFDGSVEFENVSFAYGERPILRDLSLRIEPARQLAVVGPNGAGKTTLVRLLLGLYRPEGGRLLAGGVPYDKLDLVALRRHLGVVLQDPLIFPGTIADNIRAWRPGLSDEDVRDAARRATAHDFIERLPAGYATAVGDEGELLSGGERQRVAIARALVARPRLVILDEPTTHLDDAAIASLLANLRELPGAPAVVTISHDAEVARLSDAVAHLRDGRLLEGRSAEAAPVTG
jgi:ABC-type bacteriocin/lantibiotic exporter with double-glycine peptidase domain